ncbi:hypothetical protein BXO88_16065 [Oribacterium sp. C9]|nr:hypothetical protein BXO88_16065 [Oribacterium sp. C9]
MKKILNRTNIAVAGTGYVGLSLAVLLSQHNHVVAVDIVPEFDAKRLLVSLTHGASCGSLILPQKLFGFTDIYSDTQVYLY